MTFKELDDMRDTALAIVGLAKTRLAQLAQNPSGSMPRRYELECALWRVAAEAEIAAEILRQIAAIETSRVNAAPPERRLQAAARTAAILVSAFCLLPSAL